MSLQLFNEKVRELKNLRLQITARRKEKLDKMSELKEKIRALDEKRPEGNLRQVEEEIKDIDWKIQTSSLPVKEEQELVNRDDGLDCAVTKSPETGPQSGRIQYRTESG